MKSINTAIVGYGNAGRRYHAYLIGLVEGLNLYAVATRDPERRKTAEKELGVKIYATIDDLLEDDKVDLVVIATPHDTHAELSIMAMDAGKHVVTDKIMCMNITEADMMIETSLKHNVMLGVFQNRRWDWDFSTVKKVISDGMIGKPYYFESTNMGYAPPRGWRATKSQSGGILYDWGAHLVDQMLQLVPTPVAMVHCEIQSQGWETDIGSHGKMLVRFQNDVLFQIEIGNLVSVTKPRWYVLGDQGGLIQHGLDPQEAAMFQGNIDAAEEDPAHQVKVYRRHNDDAKELLIDSIKTSWKSYYQNIAEVLTKGAELAVKPEESRMGVMILEAARKSAETGQTVKISR